jgi:hypothetical protein
LTAPELALLFFDKWYCENGLPLNIISDRDKLFMSAFWKALHKLTGVKLKMSTAFHPETDGSSERTNKMVNQALRYHVSRNQRGWVRALPRVRFDIMNTVNASTGFSGFQLRLGRSPCIIPPLVTPAARDAPDEEKLAREIIEHLALDVAEAQDNLLTAKINQAEQANKSRRPDHDLKIGNMCKLSTTNRCRVYMLTGSGRVAKYMPRFDGPYQILDKHAEFSTYTLELPNEPSRFPVFHASEIEPYIANDDVKFPSQRKTTEPEPVLNDYSEEEHFIDKIIDERPRGAENNTLFGSSEATTDGSRAAKLLTAKRLTAGWNDRRNEGTVRACPVHFLNVPAGSFSPLGFLNAPEQFCSLSPRSPTLTYGLAFFLWGGRV